MSHSYRCAVSGQSIPVASIEPTDVVVVLPDDTIMHGIWDGWDHLLPPGVSLVQAAHDIAKYQGEEFHIRKRLARLLGLELTGVPENEAAIDAAVKMVKSKYYESDKHTYASLPVSEPCPKRGLLFKSKSEWNEPKRAVAKAPAPWLKPANALVEGTNVIHAGAVDPDA